MPCYLYLSGSPLDADACLTLYWLIGWSESLFDLLACPNLSIWLIGWSEPLRVLIGLSESQVGLLACLNLYLAYRRV